MKTNCRSNGEYGGRGAARADQRGVIVVFMAILLLAFLLFIALVVDIGRILGSQRQLLNAADTASLTAANLFRINPNPTVPSWQKIEAWKRAKLAVLASLRNSQIFGCDSACLSGLANQTARFSYGTTTRCDDVAYSNQEEQIGNMRVKAERGVFCRHDGVRYFFSLERDSASGANVQYCYANAVRVQLKLQNVSPTFAKILGVGELHTAVSSESFVTPVARSCADDQCTSFGSISVVGPNATFTPFNCNVTHGDASLVAGVPVPSGDGPRLETCSCPERCDATCPTSCCGRHDAPVCAVGCPETSCLPAVCGPNGCSSTLPITVTDAL